MRSGCLGNELEVGRQLAEVLVAVDEGEALRRGIDEEIERC
jgi:hypothetical protein